MMTARNHGRCITYDFTLAFAVFIIALALRYTAFPVEDGLGFLFFYPGAAIVAVLCGLTATLSYVLLAAVAGSYLFLAPYDLLETGKLSIGLMFGLSALIIAATVHGYKWRIEANTKQLHAQLAEKELAVARWQEALTHLGAVETMFQQIFDQAGVGIAQVAPDGRLLCVNREFSEIVGYSSEELTQLSIRDLKHPDDCDRRLSNELLEGHRQFYTQEKRYLRKDKTTVWVSLTVSLVRNSDDQPSYLIGVVKDISQRKQIEAALHASEEKFRATFSNAAIGVAVTTPTGALVEFNQAFCRLTGYEPDELRQTGFQQLVLPDDSAVNLSMFEALLDGRLDSFVVENRYRQKSGREIWVRKSVSVVRDAEKRPRWTVALVENIQERKEAEKAVHQALTEARRANDAKSRFLAAASHDLRQPLSALSIYVSSLKGLVSERGEPLLGKLRACVTSLNELLDDLLDLSKLQAGVVIPKPGNFPLAQVFTELAYIHNPEAEAKGLRLRFRTTAMAVNTDRVLFRQIVGNFVANAIRYSDAGGVLVSCRRHRGKAWVEVWDTGIGIPDVHRTDIFEEFVQLSDHARKRGSGLGLAIVSRIAKLLDLEIRFESRLGHGSMFAIEVPQGTVEYLISSPAEELGHWVPLRIALIEDNLEVRTALTYGLNSVGHHVVAASSKNEIQQLLQDFSPEVVISDYRLGEGGTGFEVIHDIRERTRTDLPAIMITGDTDPQLVRTMADSGIVVLHKPIDLETLLAYVEDVTS